MKYLRSVLFLSAILFAEISFAQDNSAGKYALGLRGLYVQHHYSYGEYYANLYLSRKRSEKASYNIGLINARLNRGTISNTYGIHLFYRVYPFHLYYDIPLKFSASIGVMGFYEHSYERRYSFQKMNVDGYAFTGAFGPQATLSKRVSIEANIEIQYGKGSLINYSGYNEFGLWSPRLGYHAPVFILLEIKYQLGAK